MKKFSTAILKGNLTDTEKEILSRLTTQKINTFGELTQEDANYLITFSFPALISMLSNSTLQVTTDKTLTAIREELEAVKILKIKLSSMRFKK